MEEAVPDQIPPVRTPSAETRAADPQAVFAAGALVAAVRRLADHLEAAARELHAGDDLTVAERGLVLLLRQGGVQTIPQLAARRGASRQYLQQTLAPLVERGLVAWRENPRHRRSHLAELTPAGVGLARRVMAREGTMLGRLALAAERTRLQSATEVLQAVDVALREGTGVLVADEAGAPERSLAAEG